MHTNENGPIDWQNFIIVFKDAGELLCDACRTITAGNDAYARIGYVRQGKVTLCLNGTEQTVEAGEMYYLPQGNRASLRAVTPIASIYCTRFALSQSEQAEAEWLWLPASVCAEEPQQIESLFRWMLKLAHGSEPGAQLKLAGMLQILFAEFFPFRMPEPQKHSTTIDRKEMEIFIRNNLSGKLTLEILAAQANLTPGYFIREFERLFQLSPMEYVLRMKEHAARRYLENSGLSIKEISIRLGFSNQNYFSSFFKKRCGCAPSDYRRLNSVLALNGTGGVCTGNPLVISW